MIGISSSVFSEAGGLVKDWLKNPLNSAFLYWYFLPAAGFVLLQLFLIGPMLGHQPPRLFEADVEGGRGATELILQILSGSIFALIILPLVLGVVLSALSGTILRIYQGMFPLTRALFQPWLKRNQSRSSSLYGPLQAKRREYLFLMSHGVRLVNSGGEERAEPVTDEERDSIANQLKAEIQNLHEGFEMNSNVREVPVDVAHVGSTNLANTLAVAEEYPFERYGMDTAVFWPRLCAELAPERMESISNSFGAMNGLLNISFLSYVFGFECLLVSLATKAGWIATEAGPLVRLRWLIVAAVISFLVGMGSYRAAVRAAQSVGNDLRTAFDYHRGLILDQFKLKLPDDLEQERIAWLKLAAFIRRGESFYYPSEFRSNSTDSAG